MAAITYQLTSVFFSKSRKRCSMYTCLVAFRFTFTEDAAQDLGTGEDSGQLTAVDFCRRLKSSLNFFFNINLKYNRNVFLSKSYFQ